MVRSIGEERHGGFWANKKIIHTKNEELLNSYFELRESCYRAVPNGPKNFCGKEDNYDKVSDIILVLENEKVIGGARVTGSTPSWPLKLPVEEANFTLKKELPFLNLDRCGYCEVSRLSIEPAYRGTGIIEQIALYISELSITKGYQYLFTVAPLQRCEQYAKIFEVLNFRTKYQTFFDIDLPQKPENEYGTLKMYIGCIELPDIKIRQGIHTGETGNAYS